MSKKEQKQLPITLYTSPEGTIQLDVQIEKETIRLNQVQMSELFGVGRTVITKHIRNIIKEGELEEKSNVQKMHFAHSDKPIAFYNRFAYRGQVSAENQGTDAGCTCAACRDE